MAVFFDKNPCFIFQHFLLMIYNMLGWFFYDHSATSLRCEVALVGKG